MTARISAKLVGLILAGGLLGFASTAQAASQDTARLQEAWRTAIAHTKTPGSGCYAATYPLTVWRQTACVTAPNRPYVPALGTHGGAQTTGDGNDYAAVSATLVSAMEGTFPKAKNLKTETDGGANVYSIQLNSNFMSGDQSCANASVPATCLGWLQYVYSSSEHAAFMQYWLIFYDTTCPTGWNTFHSSTHTDCWKNSAAKSVPQEPITDLPNISLSGSAVAGGLDTLVFMDGANAFSTTGQDSVMFLANGWKESEFNVIGDGGGSAANFSAGTKLTVKIAMTNGKNKKPVCQANDGTTGETNNLTLGACTATKGSAKNGTLPSVQFIESN